MADQRTTVVVTGVGALIGQGIARSLRTGGRARIVGADRRITPFSRTFCDAVEHKPAIDEASEPYLEFWRSLVERHGVDLILPGLSVDMLFFNSNRSAFSAMGVTVALNSAELIALCADKYDFQAAYDAAGFPVIPSARPDSWEAALSKLGPAPLLLKPRRGEGSAGIVRLSDAEDFAYWTRRNGDNWLIQKIVGADTDEYTVGIYGLGDGTHLGPIIMRRRLTRSGHTGEAEVLDHPVIAELTGRIARRFQPIGPTNLQFRMEGRRRICSRSTPAFPAAARFERRSALSRRRCASNISLKAGRRTSLRSGMARRIATTRTSSWRAHRTCWRSCPTFTPIWQRLKPCLRMRVLVAATGSSAWAMSWATMPSRRNAASC